VNDALVVSLLSLLPRNRASRAMGLVARSPLSRGAVRAFAAAYGVAVDDAEHPLDAYPTLDAFFTRRLRPGARPVDPSPDTLVSPVDGACAFVGRTVEGRVEVAPGRSVALSALLGEPVRGERDVAVLYLSPRDYHRVHVPREGTLVAWRYVPGTLWPVFASAVRRVEGLFARNERAVLTTQTALGRVDVVLIGAFGVGRIEVPAIGLGTNAGHVGREGVAAVPLERGGDLGVFHLGSTVVVVLDPGAVAFQVRVGDVVRVGAPLARRGRAA
jgi:phosphatidylserine decarboxylase